MCGSRSLPDRPSAACTARRVKTVFPCAVSRTNEHRSLSREAGHHLLPARQAAGTTFRLEQQSPVGNLAGCRALRSGCWAISAAYLYCSDACPGAAPLFSAICVTKLSLPAGSSSPGRPMAPSVGRKARQEKAESCSSFEEDGHKAGHERLGTYLLANTLLRNASQWMPCLASVHCSHAPRCDAFVHESK